MATIFLSHGFMNIVYMNTMYINAQYLLWEKKSSNLRSIHPFLQKLDVDIAMHWAWSDRQLLRFVF